MVFQHGKVDDTLNSIVVPLRDMISADEQSIRVVFNWASIWTIEYHEGGHKTFFTDEDSWHRLLWLVNDERMQIANA